MTGDTPDISSREPGRDRAMNNPIMNQVTFDRLVEITNVRLVILSYRGYYERRHNKLDRLGTSFEKNNFTNYFTIKCKRFKFCISFFHTI